MNTISKILLAVAVVASVGIGTATLVQREASKEIGRAREAAAAAMERAKRAEEARDELTAKAAASAKDAEGWRETANKLVATVGRLEGRLKAMEGKLAQLGPSKPATDPASLPADAQGLAAAYTSEGFPPAIVHGTAPLAFTTGQGQPMLGLIKDGKEYPKELERNAALTEIAETLTEQKEGLTKAVEAKDKEAKGFQAAYDQQLEATHEATKAASEKDTVIAMRDAEIG